ncbi:hypothetical protein GCM10009741_00980 [Kribbella lupini]|uniref:Uncharacterized protein n=1 Tax=Kribbella lupini TaxID=291602 RepID=A0ABN1ZZV1_9ACTN
MELASAGLEVSPEVDPLVEEVSLREVAAWSADFADCGRRGVCGGMGVWGGIGVCAGRGVCPARDPTDVLAGVVGESGASAAVGTDAVGETGAFEADVLRPAAGLRVEAGDRFAVVDFAAGGFGADAPAVDPSDPADPAAGPSNGSSGDSGAAFFAAREVDFVVLRRGVFFGGWSAGPEAAGVGGWFSSLTGCSFGLAWGRADGSTSG